MLAWAESEEVIVEKYNISQIEQESGDLKREIFSYRFPFLRLIEKASLKMGFSGMKG